MPPALKRRRAESSGHGEVLHRASPLPGPYNHPSSVPRGAAMPSVEHMASVLSQDNVRGLLVRLAQEDTTKLAWSVLVDAYATVQNETTVEGDGEDGAEADSEHDEGEEDEEEEDEDGEDEDGEDETELPARPPLQNEDFTIFTQCVDAVDFAIERKYSNLNSSRQYDMADAVYSEIQGRITVIERHAQPHVSYLRKRNAVYALIQIGHLVVASAGVIAREILNLFASDTRIPELIASTLERATEPERRLIVEGSDICGGLRSLLDSARANGVTSFDGLEDTLAMLNRSMRR